LPVKSSTKRIPITSGKYEREVPCRTVAATGDKTAFQLLLDRVERDFAGKKQDVAEAIGITPSRYSRVYGGTNYGLSVENCLRLAKIANIAPTTVLQWAGKDEVAALLSELYRMNGVTPLPQTPAQVEAQEAAQVLAAMTPEDRAPWLAILRGLARSGGKSAATPLGQGPGVTGTHPKRQRRTR
jgi:transcriptional regulator with XRE-family HTH domain